MVTLGTVLDDRWRIDAPLAMGSMGEVFRGTDLSADAPCAIKVLRAEFIDDGVQVQRFEREARTTLTLRHPQVVTVHATGVVAQRPWIAMELLEGESLERVVERGAVDAETARAVVSQVAAALDAAHARGVVHRDLKPDNVFVLEGPSLRVKVLDFGFAKITDRMLMDGLRTAADTLLGTPLYMAPEQIRSSRDVDHRADLWSLAVMAYELLVGEAPFQQKKVADLFVEILSRPIDAPSTRRPGLSPTLDVWACFALERDPDRRYQTAAELSAALDAALHGQRPPPPAWMLRATAPPPSTPPKPPRALPSRAVIAAMALGALAVAAITVLVLRAT